MTDNVIEFPSRAKPTELPVPEALRRLADILESGIQIEEEGDTRAWPRGLYQSEQFAFINLDKNGHLFMGFITQDPNPWDCGDLLLAGLRELFASTRRDEASASES